MPRAFEFFYDFMSPYSYLASTRVEAVAERAGATVRFRPVYLPGVMKATDNRGPTSVAAKAVYTLKDVNDWAEHYGLPPILLPDPFPFVSAKADRVALALEAAGGPLVAFTHRLFRDIWAEQKDCNDDQVLRAALESVGADAGAMLEDQGSELIRNQLRANTDEAVERGAFGVPTFFVGGEMFVGNDRLDFVERALAKLPQQ